MLPFPPEGQNLRFYLYCPALSQPEDERSTSAFSKSSSTSFSSEVHLLEVLPVLPVVQIMVRSTIKSQCLLGGKEAITTNLKQGWKNKTAASTQPLYGNEGERGRGTIQSISSKLLYLACESGSNFLLTAPYQHIA